MKNLKIINKTSGFTLIETLVSLIVISVGILAFALLQVESLRATHVSVQRTKAIHFATDMIERMRANKIALNLASYNVGNGAAGNVATDCSTAINCNSSVMAAYDIWEWKSAIENERSGIVGGKASIINTPGQPPHSVTIDITWDDHDKASSYSLGTVIF